MTRVLVCGGRDFADETAAWNSLSGLFDEMGESTVLIHGGAPGADAIVEDYATANKLGSNVYRTNWQRDGRAADPIRNQRMIKEGRPDLVIAFPGGSGTALRSSARRQTDHCAQSADVLIGSGFSVESLPLLK